jgi:hypothetical protein
VSERSGGLDIAGLDIVVFHANGQWRREEGWVSHCYGKREPAAVYSYAGAAKSGDLVTFLLPQVAAAPGYRVTELEAIGGKAFEVTHANGLDIVMIRDGRSEYVETARLASDFAWIWVRFASPDDASPSELILLDGKKLSFEGNIVVQSDQQIECLDSRFANLEAIR